jgi:P4 family phage/plasmid primase-like protien
MTSLTRAEPLTGDDTAQAQILGLAEHKPNGRKRPKTVLLTDFHRRELVTESAIDAAVVAERGYSSIRRPTNTDAEPRNKLKRLGIPAWATKDNSSYPGLLIPMYRATGELISHQFKPYKPPKHPKTGKPRKYASRGGHVNRIDVHPRNKDRIADPSVPLWITEGIKKADALTSRGACVIALAGVFNWRSTLGTLGDWEDIPLKGREVIICFDADARTNPNVGRAMIRLGRWLASKDAQRVRYLIVPGQMGGQAVKGADDYFAAGGTLGELRAAATTTPPNTETTDDTFTDARMAETIADEVLAERFCWTNALGWMRWDGRRWSECSEAAVLDEARQYVLGRFQDAFSGMRDGQTRNTAAIDGWRSMLNKGRLAAALSLARGIVLADAADFDADPDVLNVANGVIDLRTGELLPHDPTRLVTKLAPVDYVPGATHPDWDAALAAVPGDCLEWYQTRLGQAITGHMPPDDRLVLQQGGGENGKTTMMGAVEAVLGDYFLLVSHRALLAGADAHPTELMDFRGVRLALLEETPEERSLSVTRLKQLVGTPRITARHIRQDSVTFDATHSLFLSTNYLPVVRETDHGTWRRLALLKFPYTFRKPGTPLETANDRSGDPRLRECLRGGAEGRHEAVLAWLVAGAVRWYAEEQVMPAVPQRVEGDTRAWRAESDLILGYFDERLVLDPDRHIRTDDLYADFVEWADARGHKRWTDRTFVARFGEHGDLVRRVDKRKARKGPARSVRHEGFETGNGPDQYQAWIGVRFRTSADDASDLGQCDFGTAGTASPVNQKAVPEDGLTGRSVPAVPNPQNALLAALPLGTEAYVETRISSVVDASVVGEDEGVCVCGEWVRLAGHRCYNMTSPPGASVFPHACVCGAVVAAHEEAGAHPCAADVRRSAADAA